MTIAFYQPKKFTLFFIICLNGLLLHAQWKPVDNAPSVYAVYPTAAIKNDTLVLKTFGAEQKCYYSTDAGQNWTDVSNTAYPYLYPDVFKNNKIFASGEEGVAVYQDGQWVFRNTGLPQDPSSNYRIRFVETDQKNLLAVSNISRRLYFSGNDGLSWTPAGNAGLKTGYFAAYGHFADKKIYSEGGVGNEGQAYVSTDGGASWKLVLFQNSGQRILAFSADRTLVLCRGNDNYFVHRNDSLIATSGLPKADAVDGLFRDGNKALIGTAFFSDEYTRSYYVSSDGGVHWTKGPSLLENATVIQAGKNLVALINDTSLAQSTDFGLTWTPLSAEGLPKNLSPSLFSSGDRVFVNVLGGEGVYKFNPGSSKWEASNKNIQKSSGGFFEMFKEGPDWLITGLGTFVSKDEGQSWIHNERYLHYFQKAAGRLWASDFNNLWVSTDGVAWEKAAGAPDIYALWKWKNKLIGFGEGGLEVSDNPDAGWQTLPLGNDPDLAYPSDLAFDTARWYIGTYGSIYSSDDEGLNFTKLPYFGGANTLLFHKDRLLAGNFDGIRYSDNGGLNWKDATGASGAYMDTPNGLSETNGILLAAAISKILVSSNNGANWLDFSAGLPADHHCRQVIRVGDFLYAACIAGLYRRAFNELPVATGEPLVDLYRLSPNPTTGHVYLNGNFADASLEVQVFDIHGKMVLQRVAPAGKADLNLSGLSAGMYVLKIYDGKQWSVSRVVKQ